MQSNTLDALLDRLDEAKRRFDARGGAQALGLLAQFDRRSFTDADSLIRFHEILLFMRAYPQGARVLRRVEKLLASFARRVASLEGAGADLTPLEYGEVSGIAGTFVEDTFGYDITRWLVGRHAPRVSINWGRHEDPYRLGATWPRFLPLLEEDALVEANVPYADWLDAARGRERELSWLMDCFERSGLSPRERAELYESLKLYVRWELGDSRATRTRMKRAPRKIFYHRGPLIARREVSLAAEFASPPLPLKKLSRAEGEAVLDLARETSTVRYRELYGFTHGDAARVVRADFGRGVEVFVVGVPPERRLPLRAYHAGMIFKNGVPVCYVEGLSLFERMEIGFNLYYTFREGESAWIYARVLKLFRELLGVTAFSVDPYQLGHENEEGIESGAFWFYRKMGFRPITRRAAEMLKAEERRLAARPLYRTPARRLRSLAEGHMMLETAPATPDGSWDRFRIRNVGLAVQRRMAKEFGGDATRIRRASAARVERALGLRTSRWKEGERRAFEDLALILAQIPDLARWNEDEKRALADIARARAGADESRYLRLLQRHPRLRAEVIKLGS
ncbi:MAG TPA: hypothetical protein VN256_02830 [Pyrinomonadaceae bacterium]|nr:hypothetical protein [Pyrinomonadaceae bacterium]